MTLTHYFSVYIGSLGPVKNDERANDEGGKDAPQGREGLISGCIAPLHHDTLHAFLFKTRGYYS